MKVLSILFVLVLLFTFSSANVARAQATEAVDVVDVVKATATVEKIDLEKRKVTIQLEDGKHKTVKVDKSVQNLDKLKVGDKVKMSYAEEMIIMIGKSGKQVGVTGAGAVALSPKGSKPGVVMADTVDATGKVVSVDAAKHRVVMEEPDGKHKTIKVSKKVTNLNELKPGETIDVRVTEALMVEVVK
jgi:Cu/Ag efflux protein CusF